MSPGSATAYCSIDGVLASLGITVTGAPRTLQSIYLSPSSTPVVRGATATLVPHFVDNYNGTDQIHPTIDQWLSDSPTIASVNGSGVVTASSRGTAHVTARVGSITSAAATVKVVGVISVTTSPSSISSLGVGASQLTTATVTCDIEATNLNACPAASWSSTNASVVAVDPVAYPPDGKSIRGVAQGSATVTACADNVCANIPVTVVPAVPSFSMDLHLSPSWFDPQYIPLPTSPSETLNLTFSNATNYSGVSGVQYAWSVQWNNGSFEPAGSDLTLTVATNCAMADNSFTVRLTISAPGYQTSSAESSHYLYGSGCGGED
jgi:hypothetical protein